MEYSSASGEDLVSCPYNSAHRFLRKHLQSHLIKCRISHTDAELMKCPFNVAHLIPEPEFNYHVKNCPDRANLTNYKYKIAVPKSADVKVTEQPVVESEDNWDDINVESYNPQIYASQANIIRTNVQSQLPSVKKAFRKAENERLQKHQMNVDYDTDEDSD